MPAFEEKSVLISTNAGNCVKKQLFGYGCGIRNGLEKQAASEKNERGRRARFPPHRKCARIQSARGFLGSWADERRLFLTLLVTRPLDQSPVSRRCLQGPFLPCCAEMKPMRPA